MIGSTVNIEDAFSRVTEYWFPKVIGRVNNQYVKVAKLKGELPWHQHDDEDELFLVVRGRLTIQMRDGEAALGPGELYIVPKGTQHRPVAPEECWVVLIETVTTRHTGDVDSPFTRSIEEQVG